MSCDLSPVLDISKDAIGNSLNNSTLNVQVTGECIPSVAKTVTENWLGAKGKVLLICPGQFCRNVSFSS